MMLRKCLIILGALTYFMGESYTGALAEEGQEDKLSSLLAHYDAVSPISLLEMSNNDIDVIKGSTVKILLDITELTADSYFGYQFHILNLEEPFCIKYTDHLTPTSISEDTRLLIIEGVLDQKPIRRPYYIGGQSQGLNPTGFHLKACFLTIAPASHTVIY